MEESLLVKGVAFKKTFSYAGFEQQPKKLVNPKVLCLNVELELKAERDNAEVRIEQVSVSTVDRFRASLATATDRRAFFPHHRITKRSSMPNGRSSTGNLSSSPSLARTSSSRDSRLAISRRNTLPTAKSSAPVASLPTTSAVSSAPSVDPFSRPAQTSGTSTSAPAICSRRNRSEPRGTISSKGARKRRRAQWFSGVVPTSSFRRSRGV